ncbi:hypothetical protein [Amycolatopsis sp. lyj-346]|uniref:hypothetical protein n=1 Tax=Amycolatopsis sp. lyj-346 TaxID=2789289 RepID=UPI00397D06C1
MPGSADFSTYRGRSAGDRIGRTREEKPRLAAARRVGQQELVRPDLRDAAIRAESHQRVGEHRP